MHDWRTIPDMANVGYPIAEASEDGTFVITKHAGTGGRVSVPSVSEQLVYEMGDPHAYITPDVVADFTSIQLAPDGENRVRVHGITGGPPTPFLKVSIAYRAGYKAVGSLVYCGQMPWRRRRWRTAFCESASIISASSSTRSSPSSSAPRQRTAPWRAMVATHPK
jgi:hypothetical protein